MRTAADVLSGQNLPNVNFHEVRGQMGVKESAVQLGKSEEIGLNVALCNQMRNNRGFLDQIEQKDETYRKFVMVFRTTEMIYRSNNRHRKDFIEVMTRPVGCIGGAGLPQSRDPDVFSKREWAAFIRWTSAW